MDTVRTPRFRLARRRALRGASAGPRLTAHATRLGSSDPEAAAQEAVNRSLADPRSRPALEHFFHEHPPETSPPPEWGLMRSPATSSFLYWAPVILSGAADPLPASLFER